MSLPNLNHLVRFSDCGKLEKTLREKLSTLQIIAAQ